MSLGKTHRWQPIKGQESEQSTIRERGWWQTWNIGSVSFSIF